MLVGARDVMGFSQPMPVTLIDTSYIVLINGMEALVGDKIPFIATEMCLLSSDG